MNNRILPALGTVFAAAMTALPAIAQTQEYTVVESHVREGYMMTLPDRKLPDAGPGRTAAQRWVKDLPARADQYTTVLQDESGNRVQCLGLKIDAADDASRVLLQRWDFEGMATSKPLLRVMHPAQKGASWPLQMGGCVRLNPEEQERDAHRMLIKLGVDIVNDIDLFLYVRKETPAERDARWDIENLGGVSIAGNRLLKCPSAGWNDALGRARPGDKVQVPGLCPR